MVSPFGPMAETTVLELGVNERAQAAAELLASVIDDHTMAAMAARTRSSGLALMGEGGLMQQMFKRFLEASLQGEMDAHLGSLRKDFDLVSERV